MGKCGRGPTPGRAALPTFLSCHKTAKAITGPAVHPGAREKRLDLGTLQKEEPRRTFQNHALHLGSTGLGGERGSGKSMKSPRQCAAGSIHNAKLII